MEEMNQLGLKFCHNETPCIAMLEKQKCYLFFFFFFTKNRGQKGETGPVGGLVTEGWGRMKGKGVRK
jgi:hypothetical protein